MWRHKEIEINFINCVLVAAASQLLLMFNCLNVTTSETEVVKSM